MTITQEQYAEMVEYASPKSTIVRDCTGAFLVGGLICTFGQLITDAYTMMNFSLKDARCLTSVTLVFLGALFTAFSWYDNIAKFAGAGTIVPITGFSNAVVSPAIEFKSEGLVLGLGAKMFIIAGPVIVYGTVVSVLYGLVLCIGKYLL